MNREEKKDYFLIQKNLKNKLRASSLDALRMRQIEELLYNIECFWKKF